jgi:hypothetical protein
MRKMRRGPIGDEIFTTSERKPGLAGYREKRGGLQPRVATPQMAGKLQYMCFGRRTEKIFPHGYTLCNAGADESQKSANPLIINGNP